jgi:hypothetical protein
MINDKYILDGHKVIPVDNVLEWGRWFETADRIVKQETLPNGIWVSTVFLGLDMAYSFAPNHKPLIFETMAFAKNKRYFKIGGRRKYFHEDLDQNRYSTWEEAEVGHKAMVKKWSKK